MQQHPVPPKPTVLCRAVLCCAVLHRVNKVSELARTVSQQATARASTLKGELSAAQDQARRSRRRAAAAEAKAAATAEENARLRQQLALLEQVRLSHDDFRTSACAREYLFSHSVSLY
jgi:septal ring factor EnvC (AmiA/AmiB activator)